MELDVGMAQQQPPIPLLPLLAPQPIVRVLTKAKASINKLQKSAIRDWFNANTAEFWNRVEAKNQLHELLVLASEPATGADDAGKTAIQIFKDLTVAQLLRQWKKFTNNINLRHDIGQSLYTATLGIEALLSHDKIISLLASYNDYFKKINDFNSLPAFLKIFLDACSSAISLSNNSMKSSSSILFSTEFGGNDNKLVVESFIKYCVFLLKYYANFWADVDYYEERGKLNDGINDLESEWILIRHAEMTNTNNLPASTFCQIPIVQTALEQHVHEMYPSLLESSLPLAVFSPLKCHLKSLL